MRATFLVLILVSALVLHVAQGKSVSKKSATHVAASHESVKKESVAHTKKKSPASSLLAAEEALKEKHVSKQTTTASAAATAIKSSAKKKKKTTTTSSSANKKKSAAETAVHALKANTKAKKVPTHLKGIAAGPVVVTTGRPNPSPPRGGVCRATRNISSITPVKAKILGPLSHQVGEWIYVQVMVSGEMSDPNIHAACTAAGFVTPCPGGPDCYMNNEHCTVTTETGCDYPMRTLAASLCGSGVDPKNCPALAGPGTFAYVGETWACSGCGAVTGPTSSNPLDYCELGFKPSSLGKYALCAYHQSHVLNLDGVPAVNSFPK